MSAYVFVFIFVAPTFSLANSFLFDFLQICANARTNGERKKNWQKAESHVFAFTDFILTRTKQ